MQLTWLLDVGGLMQISHLMQQEKKKIQPLTDAINSIRPGNKMLSYHDLRGKILGKTIEEVNGFMEHYKST